MSVSFVVRTQNGALWNNEAKHDIYKRLLAACLKNSLINEYPDARRMIERFIAGPVPETFFETTDEHIRLVSTQKKCRATIILAYRWKNVPAYNRKNVILGFDKLAHRLNVATTAPTQEVYARCVKST